jgi:hypothetical protein
MSESANAASDILIVPPRDVASAALAALAHRSTDVSPVAMHVARKLADRAPMRLATIKRLASFFERYDGDAAAAMDAPAHHTRKVYGGDAGAAWARLVVLGVGSREDDARIDVEFRAPVVKLKPEERLAFGWLYVSRRADGTRVEDHSDEIVSIETIEPAIYDFNLKSRMAGTLHKKVSGRLVESVVFTAEKRAAMCIPDGVVPDGAWVGFRVDDDDTYADLKSGKLKMLSFGGLCRRVPVDEP